MPTDFTLPELGENVTAGDVVRVLVAIGDSVAKDQAVLELETDKATIEVPSSVSGTVKEVRVKEGDKIKVGQVVLTFDDDGPAKGAQ
ncbi:MAG: biotin/lipoyl-binding protein, partial [Acidobacteriota bacterium]|nr:biotin/lipoyl-binding protein [Acidobacteriota bacterium]